MANNVDNVRPSVRGSERKYKKSIGKIIRIYLLVFCFTLVITKGFLFVDALEHRHRGE